MIVTPHIVRSHELTAADVQPLYVGTGQNFGAGTPPSLFPPGAPPPPEPAGVTGGTVSNPPAAGTGRGAGGAPTQPTTPPANPTTPPAGVTPPAGGRGEAPPRPTIVPLEPVTGAPAGAAPQAPPAQVVVTVPTQPLTVGGVPGTVPLTITGVSQVSAVSITITYDPKVVRAVSVSQGLFMQQGGNQPTFSQKLDTPGRVDIAIARTKDESGASGTGLLAGILFQPVAAGTSPITVTAVVLNAAGQPVAVQIAPASITVK